MQAWDTKTRHSPYLIRPTKTGPTTCLPIWQPTLAWIASAPTRALGNSIGASDYLSDASCRLRPSVGVWVVGREAATRKSVTSALPVIRPESAMASEAFKFRPRGLWPVWQNWQPNAEPRS